jgi:hypothetical protein
MKRFKCVVETRKEYIVEINEEVHNQEWMDHYKRYFIDVDSLDEHAENIAWNRAVHGESHYEGYGYVLVDGRNPFMRKDDEVTKSINIKIIDEDDIEIDVVELD